MDNTTQKYLGWQCLRYVNISDLNDKVTNLLDAGWDLYGDVKITVFDGVGIITTQVMVMINDKYDPDD